MSKENGRFASPYKHGHDFLDVCGRVTPAHLNSSKGRRLLWAMRPKFSMYTIRIWAMIRKIFYINRPVGRK